jgi:hypothetical protein
MGRTERGKRDAKLALRRFDVGRILQDGLNQSAPFVFRPFVVGTNHLDEITLDLKGDHFQDVGQVFAFGRSFTVSWPFLALAKGR